MSYSTSAHLRDALTYAVCVARECREAGEKSLRASAEELIQDIKDELKRREIEAALKT